MDKSPHYITMCESAKVHTRGSGNLSLEDFFVSMSLGLTSPCQPIASDLEKKVSSLKDNKGCITSRDKTNYKRCN